MTLTINIEGKGVIANADAISDSAGGTWSEQGGGTIAVSNDVFLIGSGCIGGKYAGKSGFHQYDIGSGNELDFTASTGTEAGQCLYIWISMTALGTLDTLSTYPLTVRLSSSSPGTSNYIDYVIAGSDDKNGWDGGFRCFVIDPTKTPSRVSGTQSSIIASVRTMGVWIDCSGSARADSIFVDQMAVGSGLRVTGTSTTGWSDVVDYCTDYSTRGWGMMQEREGIYYAYGNMIIGDDTTPQSSAVSFTDSGRVVQFGFTEYCTDVSAGTWANSMSTGFSGVTIEDDAATTNGVTTFSDGVVVGTDSGRSGSVFIGNPTMDVFMDLYGGSNVNSVTTLYGTNFKDITGAINSGNDSDHKFYSVSFSGCSQVDPVGAPVIRNCVFAETADVDAALLWNSSIDMEQCSFIANTTGAAIEHPTAGSFDYNDLTFSGNANDILNSEDGGTSLYYSETNQTSSWTVGSIYDAVAQSFTGDGNKLINARFYLAKVGSPTGNAVAKLYAHAGTYGTSGIPTGSPLATSNSVDVSTIGTSSSWVDFYFPTTEQYTLTNSTYYVIVLEYDGGDASNNITSAYDNAGTYSGNFSNHLGTIWTSLSSNDMVFQVLTDNDSVTLASVGSNPATSEYSGTPDSYTEIQTSVNINIYVKDSDNNAVENAAVAVYKTSDDTELMNELSAATTGLATESYNYLADTPVYIRVRKSSTGTRYFPVNTTGTIDNGGLTLTVVLNEDNIVA